MMQKSEGHPGLACELDRTTGRKQEEDGRLRSKQERGWRSGDDGTRAVLVGCLLMTVSLSQLLEDSFQIAWEYLERSGELGDGAAASQFLSDVIETMIRWGQRSRLALSNRAINAYQRFRSSRDAGSEQVRSSA
jgi:hypothetical protein